MAHIPGQRLVSGDNAPYLRTMARVRLRYLGVWVQAGQFGLPAYNPLMPPTPRFKIAFIGTTGWGRPRSATASRRGSSGGTWRSRWCTRWRGGARCRSTRRRRSRRSRGSSTPRSPRSWSPRRGIRWWSATAACSTTTSISCSPPAARRGRSAAGRVLAPGLRPAGPRPHRRAALSPDGVRSPDPGFQHAVEERLVQEVAERRLPVLRLDPAARPAGSTRSSGPPGSGCARPSSRCLPVEAGAGARPPLQ